MKEVKSLYGKWVFSLDFLKMRNILALINHNFTGVFFPTLDIEVPFFEVTMKKVLEHD
jgi:hypothetical protein